MLLEIPVELIQLILRYANAESFLYAAYCCHTLYEIASTSRDVLLVHLSETPGVSIDLKKMGTKDLFRLLQIRGAAQLYGAQFFSTRVTYSLNGSIIDTRASSLSSPDGARVAITSKNGDFVNLYEISDAALTLIRSITLPVEEPGTVKVLKTAFTRDNGVAALFRFTPQREMATEEESVQSFVRQARQTPIQSTLLLVIMPKTAPDITYLCSFQHHNDCEPFALAVSSELCFAISWQLYRPELGYEVVLYNADPAFPGGAGSIRHLEYTSMAILDEQGAWSTSDEGWVPPLPTTSGDGLGLRRVTSLAFNDEGSQLLYSQPGDTLYRAFQNIHQEETNRVTCSKLYFNCTRVQVSLATRRFHISIPFYGTHSTQVLSGRSICRWTYLSFGVQTQSEGQRPLACLLKSRAVCRFHHCTHVLNLDRGRRLNDWDIVAVLQDYPASSSSLGNVVAASLDGSRLAVASWKKVFIWVIEPNVILETGAGYYPKSWEKLSESEDRLIFNLPPVMIDIDAVCFQMKFTENRDELLLLTDRGLIAWNLDPWGKGIQATRTL